MVHPRAFRRSLRAVLLLALAASACLGAWPRLLPLASAALPPAVAPLPGGVVRGFDPPTKDWLPGHRGVDLAGRPGDLVVAAAAGRVRFAGLVAGQGVVSIDHGEVTTTYEPVEPLVAAGDLVFPGDAVGRLAAGHVCPAAACLHWGLKRGAEYLNPLALLVGADVRLISAAAFDDLGQRFLKWQELQRQLAARSSAGLVAPVDAPVTSPFGYRVNPISGQSEFHDGTDLGVACGVPVRAAAAGTIIQQSWYGGFGNRVTIDHGQVGGHAWRTAYNHLQGYALSAGATVAQGEVIGFVGTTGYSTGCHLHFIVWRDGAVIDPMTVV